MRDDEGKVDLGGIEPPYSEALSKAANLIPAYAEILGLGEGIGALRSVLPPGCTLSAVDAPPAATHADIVVMLDTGTMSAAELARTAADLGKPFLCAWPMAGTDDVRFLELRRSMESVGFGLRCSDPVASGLALLKWVSARELGPVPQRLKRVLVMSYFNMANFGDRLGYHVLNHILPPDVEVAYGQIRPWTVPPGEFDLLVLGIGNSLIANDACLPELADLLTRIPCSIGIFGIQFREQFREPAAARALEFILSKLTTWWARYEEDVLAFGKDRANVRHLGDWLIAAFPLATPTKDKGLTIPADIIKDEKPLDRVIQQIQSYRGVSSARLHTLLCALTSADDVAYTEQRIDGRGDAASGKFRSLLYDIFGRTFDEGALFPVDRGDVVRYKRKVGANIAALQRELFGLLDRAPPVA